MIRYEGMKAEESKGTLKNIPAGPYVAKVLKTEIIGNEPDQQLAVVIDIWEGQFAGWYMTKFKADQEKGSNFPVKYKGVLRIRIPNSENKNARYPESDLRRFNDMIWRFEQSNEGFRWDGDETKLKGLLIGISIQEDTYNGKLFTKPARFEIVDDVRQGKIQVMAPRKREEDIENPTMAPKMTDQRSGMEVVTEKLPWDTENIPF